MNPILKSYFVIADTIAGTFGEQCEVCLLYTSDAADE